MRGLVCLRHVSFETSSKDLGIGQLISAELPIDMIWGWQLLAVESRESTAR